MSKKIKKKEVKNYNPKAVGRDWFNGKPEDMVVSKLKTAFEQGSNVLRSCAYAEITNKSYYRYLEAHPELRDIFEYARQKPILLAESNLIKKLNEGDVETSKWYLERKAKGEYSTRQEVVPVNPDEDDLSEEEKEKLRKILRDNSK